MLRNNRKRRKRRLDRSKWHILIASASCLSPSLSSSELKICVFMTGSSSKSSRTSLDPSSEDKFASGPRVVELGIEDRVTTKEKPSFHGLGEADERIAGKYNRRSSRRGALNLRHPCRSNSLLRSGDLGWNRGRLPSSNPLDLGTLLDRNGLRWRDWSLSRSSLCISSNKSRSHGLSQDIYPVEKALHRCTSSSKSLLTHKVINREGLGINLKEEY